MKPKAKEGERKWMADSRKWRAELGLGPDMSPYSSTLKEDPNFKPTKRVLDLLDCTAVQLCVSQNKRIKRFHSKEMEDAVRGSFVDISQSHGRRPFNMPGAAAHTLTTGSQLYSFEHRRVLEPAEHLALQGYPDGFSASKLRAIAGEGIALPCLALVIWALYLVRPLPIGGQTHSSGSDED